MNPMKKMICTGLISVISLALSGGELSLTGVYKIFLSGLKPSVITVGEDGFSQTAEGLATQRLRLKVTGELTSFLSFQGAYDLSAQIRDFSFSAGNFGFSANGAGDYRFDDLSQRLYPGGGQELGSLVVMHNLDRLFLKVTTPWADLYFGRQAIAWGSARIVNPTDIIAPFAFTELDSEERKGVDAVRVRIPLGMMDELDMGFVAGEGLRAENNAYFLRGRFNLLHSDFSVLLMGFRENLMLGLDLSRSIGGAGFWLETALVLPHSTEGGEKGGRPEEKPYLRLSTGLDGNFSDRFSGFFEYHFSSCGRGSNGDTNAFLSRSACMDGAVYLMGRHYLSLGAKFQLTPLLPLEGLFIWNLNDGSLMMAPSLEYNLAENIYIGAGAFMGTGKQKEFGLYPDLIYTSFRVYF